MSTTGIGSCLCLAMLLGCAGTIGESRGPRPLTRALLTGADMEATGLRDAYQGAQWLTAASVPRAGDRSEGAPVLGEVAIYVDGVRVNGLEALQHIPAAWVTTIRLVKRDERLASGPRGVAIVVSTNLPH